MDRGINELFEGLTITYGNRKYILPPSSFAEAEIGLMTEAEIMHGLEEVLQKVQTDTSLEAPAIRAALKKHGGSISLEDVMEKVKMHHEKQAKLITENAVVQNRLTGGGVLFYEIERRGDSRGARNRQVKIEMDSIGRILHFSCPCETHDTNFAKGNFDPLSAENSAPVLGVSRKNADISGFPMYVTGIACYHIAVALIHRSRKTGKYKVPFEFSETTKYESLFMDVFSRKKEALVDDYLIRSGSITAETAQLIADGEFTLEVVKHSKNIDGRSKEMINGIRLARESDGYQFSGFATDFRGTTYQTASIVLSKTDGRSLHILYDGKIGLELPFMMLNVPLKVWDAERRQPITKRLEGDIIGSARTYLRRFDERTQQEVISIITWPDKRLLKGAEFTAYSRAINERRQRQAALT